MVNSLKKTAAICEGVIGISSCQLAVEIPVEELNVKLAKENIYDAPVKTQIVQSWYVTKVSEGTAELEDLIAKLHQRALSRRGFKHLNPATGLYTYV